MYSEYILFKYQLIPLPLQIYMTPEDFLRSLTPGMIQPQGLGLDQFKKFDPNTMNFKEVQQTLPEDSIFYRLGTSGLISFSDYIFLLTILSTSRYFDYIVLGNEYIFCLTQVNSTHLEYNIRYFYFKATI